MQFLLRTVLLGILYFGGLVGPEDCVVCPLGPAVWPLDPAVCSLDSTVRPPDPAVRPLDPAVPPLNPPETRSDIREKFKSVGE